MTDDDMNLPIDKQRRRGRGTTSNRSGRFESETRVDVDDGWDTATELAPFQTSVQDEPARTIITKNTSPDIPFNQSINPYRGCEHGCTYCYARPSHTFLGHSAGLDFETQLYAKPNAAALLKRELSNPRYKPQTIALGTNTDPYQPIERTRGITRGILQTLLEHAHPATIVTKSASVLRDIDILARMSNKNLIKVALSVTTLDAKLARAMEPRASTPQKRLDALTQLTQAGVPTTVMVAPIIPALTDHEIETILEQAANAGVTEAGYVLLRLPLEVRELFEEWLHEFAPNRAKRVLNMMRDLHAGNVYNSAFHTRQRGRGPYADMISHRFNTALKNLDLNESSTALSTEHFTPPRKTTAQLDLF